MSVAAANVGIHGSIAEFVPGKEDWTTYQERLDLYFLANGVTTDEKKRAIHLSVSSTATYKLIRSLVGGAEALKTTAYVDICSKLKDHYDPAPSSIVQRFKFNSRVRAAGESIADYLAALRDLSQHCEYGDTLPNMLRDRLVCGVNDERIQKPVTSGSSANVRQSEKACIGNRSSRQRYPGIESRWRRGASSAYPLRQGRQEATECPRESFLLSMRRGAPRDSVSSQRE